MLVVKHPSTAVEWAMVEMLRNPRVMKEAQAEESESLTEKETLMQLESMNSTT